MEWKEAVEAMVSRTNHSHFRILCDDSHPDREIWRRKMVHLATGIEPPAIPLPTSQDPPSKGGCGCKDGPPKPPSPAAQAKAVALAAGRWAARGFRMASPKVQDDRRDICDLCEFHDEERDRCMKCGCFLNMKIRLPAERCPIGRWGAEDISDQGWASDRPEKS